MMVRAPKWLGRVAAVALLFAVVGGIGAAVAVPLFGAHARFDDSIEALRHQHRKLTEVAATQNSLQEQLARIESQRPGDEYLLGGESDALSGAELQDLAKEIVVRNGGKLESTQVLPAASEGVLERITVRARFSSNIPSLQRTLYVFEAGKPALFVDRIEIRADTAAARQVAGGAARGMPLKVSMDVYGYRRKGGV